MWRQTCSAASSLIRAPAQSPSGHMSLDVASLQPPPSGLALTWPHQCPSHLQGHESVPEDGHTFPAQSLVS